MKKNKRILSRFKALSLLAGMLVLLLALTSCNAEKRAARHIKKAIALDPTITFIDTIRDTIEARRLDTLVSLPFGKPTVITRDGITLTLQPMEPMNVNPIINVTAETEEVIREIPVERIKYVTNPPTFWDDAKDILIWVFMGLLVLLIIRMIIDKIFNK